MRAVIVMLMINQTLIPVLILRFSLFALYASMPKKTKPQTLITVAAPVRPIKNNVQNVAELIKTPPDIK